MSTEYAKLDSKNRRYWQNKFTGTVQFDLFSAADYPRSEFDKKPPNFLKLDDGRYVYQVSLRDWLESNYPDDSEFVQHMMNYYRENGGRFLGYGYCVHMREIRKARKAGFEIPDIALRDYK